MVSRTIEICIKDQCNENENVLFSLRPNLRRFEFFKEDLMNRRPDLRYQPMKIYYKSFNWVKSSDRPGIPEHAVIAGRDVDGSTIYAGRALYSGHYIPAKIIPSKKIAYVPWKGHENSSHDYEFLCGTHFEWVKSSNGHVPPGAVCSGNQVDGLPLYVGRTNIGGSLAVGKVHTRYNCIYVPFDGREHSISHYEVLVERKQGLNWTQPNEMYPMDAVAAGYDADGSTIYVGRAYHQGHYIPAKAIPSKRVAYISWGGSEHVKRDYELLIGRAYQWVKSSNGQAPSRAVIAGRENNIPLYVGRAHIGGSMAVGKVHPAYKLFYVPFNGREHTIKNYEVLVDLGTGFGGSNVYIDNETAFITFVNHNTNKMFIETMFNVASFASQNSRLLRHNVSCTGCGNEIYDIRYKCMECRDVNLCMECEPKMHKQHLMLRIAHPNDEPIVTEKAAPTNQARTKIEAEIKEVPKHGPLDFLQSEMMKLGLAGLKILLNDTTASFSSAQSSEPYRPTASTQKQSQSAAQSMPKAEPYVATSQTETQVTPLYPQIPNQPNAPSFPRTTNQPMTETVAVTRTIAQNKSQLDFQPTAPSLPQPDERVNNGLKVMTAMGFSNEGNWLTLLLESVDGNVGKALDLMQNKK